MRRGALVVAVVAAALAAPASAWAHAALLHTTPAASVVLNRPPKQVAMTYSEAVEPRFAVVSITDAAGRGVAAGPPGRSPTNPDTLVTKLKASFTFCENAFAQLDDAKLGDQVSMTFGGQTRNVIRAGMVLGHALDMADHYSQIANYMRLNGMLPPTALPRPNRAGP